MVPRIRDVELKNFIEVRDIDIDDHDFDFIELDDVDLVDTIEIEDFDD